MLIVKPGMRRSDLLLVFTTEGGLSTPLERTFISRDCPYFKVDVTFKEIGQRDFSEQARLNQVEHPHDEIVSISRPYIAFSIMD